jgi:hypothetical protein
MVITLLPTSLTEFLLHFAGHATHLLPLYLSAGGTVEVSCTFCDHLW